jgi:hypothetical protein
MPIGSTGGSGGAPGAPGADGQDAFVYIAYASDSSGANFTLTPLSNSTHLAVIQSPVAIPAPNASNFTGRWQRVRGDAGAAGSPSLAGYQEPVEEYLASTAGPTLTINLATLGKNNAIVDLDANITIDFAGAPSTDNVRPFVLALRGGTATRTVTFSNNVRFPKEKTTQTIIVGANSWVELSIRRYDGISAYLASYTDEYNLVSSGTPGEFNQRIAASTDDGWATPTVMNLTQARLYPDSSGLDVKNYFRWVPGTPPHAGANIEVATLFFTAIEQTGVGTKAFTVRGQKGSNPATFSTLVDLNARTLTTAQNVITPGANGDAAWAAAGAEYAVDVTAILQEIVNDAGYASGHAIALITSNNSQVGDLTIHSWNGDPARAARLFTRWS